ncbi:hypothetical protein EV174_002955 [Coemansia sp. RSA 2320]|nr:hypothetical protein EV174_002955 [Coemansia sp. RSA 2320]
MTAAAIATQSPGLADDRRTVVLVTGCSAGGIGHHLALEFAARGCRVFAAVRSLEKAPSLASQNIEAVELDVTSGASVDAAVSHVLASAGRIDMLVNNAGVLCVGPAVEVDEDRIRQTFDTNVVGLARMCRAVAPAMMDRRRGVIVNVGSVSGYSTTPWVGYYAASKAAAHALSDALRMELAPFGVSVVVVAPGGIKSNLAGNLHHRADPLSRYASARPAIEARATFSQSDGATSTSRFAQVVVPQLLRRNPRAYITYGNHATSTWLLYYVPPAIRDFFLARRFGTRQLALDLAATLAEESTAKCPMSQGKASGGAAGARSGGKCPFANPELGVIGRSGD